jgi:hypothetical protein
MVISRRIWIKIIGNYFFFHQQTSDSKRQASFRQTTDPLLTHTTHTRLTSTANTFKKYSLFRLSYEYNILFKRCSYNNKGKTTYNYPTASHQPTTASEAPNL